MAESTNRVHVSPGVYTSESVDMKAAAKSVGVTKLAVVGETLKGQAFQPTWVSSPNEFTSIFGGTKPSKFKGSNYPQYELPYIAEDYLTKSNQLCVVRTLGFSGYNAGPAWLITGQKSNGGNKKYVIAVLRSRGTYKYRPEFAKVADGGCSCQNAYDSMTFNVGEVSGVASCAAPTTYNMDAVKLDNYYSLSSEGSQCTSFSLNGEVVGFSASAGDMGRFTIQCLVGPNVNGVSPKTIGDKTNVVNIPVSLNPSDKDFILKVLGSSNDDGDQPLYVESLYDVAWQELVIAHGYDTISSEVVGYNVGYAADYNGIGSVNGLLTKHEGELSKKDIGKRYLYTTNLTNASPEDVEYYSFDYTTNRPMKVSSKVMTAVTYSAASTCEVVIEDDEMFEITDGAFAGIYKNKTGIIKSVKDLLGSALINNTNEDVILTKVTGIEAFEKKACEEGKVYTVAQISDSTGKKYIVYKAFAPESLTGVTDADDYISLNDKLKTKWETSAVNRRGSVVYNYEDGLYYKNAAIPTELGVVSGIKLGESFNVNQCGGLYIVGANNLWILNDGTNEVPRNDDGTWNVDTGFTYTFTSGMGEDVIYKGVIYKQDASGKVEATDNIVPVSCDLNDYKTGYRYSSTPWVVSNAKGDANHIDVNKMFRFHTISDGANSITEVKVSIENIRPDSGQFDVIVRNYNDVDGSPVILERFQKCTMNPGKKFIGYMIGTIDGQYESKSKYITVEVAESSAARNSIPAGFLGYSTPRYDGASIADDVHENILVAPITYNVTFDETKNKRKQYFGLSDLSGYDYDYFSYKGKMSTLEDPEFMSHGFHMDCRLDQSIYSGDAPKITVDGEEGYIFDTVSINARTAALDGTPIIANEDEMIGSIYEDIKTRKFTLIFAGGFDGWDVYRDRRTNTDEFTYANYKGYVNKSSGVGYAFDTFSTFNNASTYDLEGAALTSDYYSTLAGVSLLKNPEEVDINLLATPGIDTVNNAALVREIFDILEDRADTLYVVTTPDKTIGSGDYIDEIPEVEESILDFQDKELYSDYAATYYPWVEIEDNGQYIWIPATRDVVRNMAESDNGNTTQNLAPAGLKRGKVKAIRARKNLKNEECDSLYEASINPVRTFAQDGIVVMGQKTLRESDDLLNRVDVRRSVLRMRKLIAIGTLGLVFEPNDDSTVKSFKSIVNGIMEGFVKNRAIKKWYMEVDESEEARDRLEIPATIYVMPTRALEYISVNFVVTNNGAYFED